MKKYNTIIGLLVLIAIQMVIAIDLYLDIRTLNNISHNGVLELNAILSGLQLIKTIFLVIMIGFIAATSNIMYGYYRSTKELEEEQDKLDQALEERRNKISKSVSKPVDVDSDYKGIRFERKETKPAEDDEKEPRREDYPLGEEGDKVYRSACNRYNDQGFRRSMKEKLDRM